ncbi:DUF2256 domain-containing protein [Salinivibrio kushneri]
MCVQAALSTRTRARKNHVHLPFSLLEATQMAHKKPHLPSKVCLTCERPFTWRKKWARCWDEVRYCSDRCRREGRRHARAATH